MNPTWTHSKYFKLFAVPGALLFLGTWLYSHIAQSIFHSFKFDGFIANGPFQLFNPLRRIAAGQTAGVDFQFFHGLGIPFLHYPLFALFGKTIYASELSRNLTTLFLFISSLLFLAYIFTERNLIHTLYFTVSAICFLEFLAFDKIDAYGLALATPGNSLLGARSAMPIFTFAILLTRINPSLKAVLTGIFFALAFFCGTEHGMALIASFGITVILTLLIQFHKNRKCNAPSNKPFSFIFLVITGITWGCFTLIIYGVFTRFSGIGAALKYNLVEVPADQFWYFGAPPNNYASTLLDFFILPWQGLLIFALTILLLIRFYVNSLRAETNDQSTFSFCMAHMLCYGAISCASCLGMLEEGYFLPLVRIVLLVLLMWAYKSKEILIEHFFSKYSTAHLSLVKIGLLVFALLPFVAILCISYTRSPALFTSNYFNFTPQLSKSWLNHFSKIDEAIDKHFPASAKLTFWSTYAGLLEDRHNFFLPKEDYIIHALGKEKRAQYLVSFENQKPDLVQTIRRSYFNTYTRNHDYEQWLRNTTWDFYETILNNYEILEVTDRSLFWKRKNSTWVSLKNDYVEIPSRPQQDTIELPLAALKDIDFIVVKLKYSIHNPWKKLPLFGGLPRYLVTFENTSRDLPVSLPPYQEEFTFPVMIIKGAVPKLLIQTSSLLPGAHIEIRGIAIKPYKLTDGQRIFLLD